MTRREQDGANKNKEQHAEIQKFRFRYESHGPERQTIAISLKNWMYLDLEGHHLTLWRLIVTNIS